MSSLSNGNNRNKLQAKKTGCRVSQQKRTICCPGSAQTFGKTVAAVNDLIKSCFDIDMPNVRVAYIAPYLSQAKAVAWDYALEYTRDIPHIKVNHSELRIDFPNGARFRLFGGDNYNAIRGLFFDHVCIDEFADFPASAYPTVIRPATVDRKGKITIIGTPKGKNEFWEMYEYAKNHKDWWCKMYRASETDILDTEELKEAKAAMGEDRYEQEFECSLKQQSRAHIMQWK